ncbi:hypothetical protein M0R45_008510 [Rubus argutus]|uniref:Uncharacterized protein n=1 Tax=Rubus argutus TaxID=59490 RepID=A0AAW1Y396_RUBAR
MLLSVSSASSSGVLPEFHVGMFKDLASADGSIREAAVEALATELMEVQRGYEWLENKELAKDGGVKLESETDDGWNVCAPSLRYALLHSWCFFIKRGSTIHSINVDSLLKLIVDFLEVSLSMKGRLAEEWISERNTPLIKEFTCLPIALASKKRYLQEPAV